MARTHSDVVQRAALIVGLRRSGQDLDGSLFVELKDAFTDLLRDLNEDVGLDFDPTDGTDIPEARAGRLASLLVLQPIFDQFDRTRTPTERAVVETVARKRFFGQVVGRSDFIEDEVRDY